MELIICILIFLFILLIIIGALYLYRSKLDSGSKEVHQRLERATLEEKRSQAINIMRTERKLSNVQWFDHLLRNTSFCTKNRQYFTTVRFTLTRLLHSCQSRFFWAFLDLFAHST